MGAPVRRRPAATSTPRERRRRAGRRGQPALRRSKPRRRFGASLSGRGSRVFPAWREIRWPPGCYARRISPDYPPECAGLAPPGGKAASLAWANRPRSRPRADPLPGRRGRDWTRPAEQVGEDQHAAAVADPLERGLDLLAGLVDLFRGLDGHRLHAGKLSHDFLRRAEESRPKLPVGDDHDPDHGLFVAPRRDVAPTPRTPCPACVAPVLPPAPRIDGVPRCIRSRSSSTPSPRARTGAAQR